MTTREETGLSFAAVGHLAPPVRLVSAALWKVLKQRDVKRYGAVEEFVSAVCDTVPGLLALRHQFKLTLGLQARLILDMLTNQTDVKLIKEHLERVRIPAEHAAKKDTKIRKSVENFHELVDLMIINQKFKDKFIKEVFLQDYGPDFDQKLETLMWEFLIRLDQLLPSPTLLQTVQWLSGAPFVKEECVLAASQPQLLSILLQHQVSLGHLESAASNSGDLTLNSLSLPPSGKAPLDAGHTTLSEEDCDQTNTTGEKAFVSPVIGSILNDSVSVCARTRRQRAGEATVSTPNSPTDSLMVDLPKSKEKRADVSYSKSRSCPPESVPSSDTSKSSTEIRRHDRQRHSCHFSRAARAQDSFFQL